MSKAQRERFLGMLLFAAAFPPRVPLVTQVLFGHPHASVDTQQHLPMPLSRGGAERRVCRLGRSRSGCKVLGPGKHPGKMDGGRGRDAARWFGGRLSEGITIKRGLAPSSLMCSSLARERGFLLLSLRTEDVGEQNWNLGPCAA